MIVRLSRFIHRLPLGEGRVLVIHALSHLRLTADAELAGLIEVFAQPQAVGDDAPARAAVEALIERGILTDKTPQAELDEAAAALGAYHGRDPEALLQQFRRAAREGGETYWAAGSALGPGDLAGQGRRMDVILLGDCDIQMEADFLRREGAKRGLDLRVAASFPDDLRLAAEHAHEAVLIGALRARHTIADPMPPGGGEAPFNAFIAQARAMIEGLRALTQAPILIDNLPEPTVQPQGFADRGLFGHRSRFRLANVSLAELVEEYPDVHVVDVAAVLAGAGAERLLDDSQVGFTHFGSPGWMLQRPPTEKAAVWDQFPDPAPLARLMDGDPYAREKLMAQAHLDALAVVTGHDRKKCVIVDLDGTLWPGVLAETGAPFNWTPEVSGPFSYIGLYFGLHEALLCLKQRGVLLACVSKNDEATVRELWRYPDHYPRERLLTPEDFVAWRVNWTDKVENILSLADQLGFAPESFLFIDDNPVERDRVRQFLPQVEVWGENPFSLRRRLLTDPRLQTPRLTTESAARTDATKAQLQRQHARAASLDEAGFLASLNVRTEVRRLAADHVGLLETLARVEELFQRTTQFNTTGAKFPLAALQALLARPDAAVFAVHVRDRFGDHGLAGAAVVEAGEIGGLAMSCRVLGLGVEHAFIDAMVQALAEDQEVLSGRIIETARNGPVRNLYADNGFTRGPDQVWRRSLRAPEAAARQA